MLIGIVLTLVSIWYGQNHGLMPVAASKEAPLVDGLFNTMMTISTGLFILVQGVLIISAIKFRRRRGDEADAEPVHGNIPLEILWTAIPAILVLGISIYSFDVYNEMGGIDPMNHSMAHGKSEKSVAHMPGAAIAATLPAASEPLSTGMTASASDPSASSQPIASSNIGIGSTPEQQNSPTELTVNVAGLQYAWIFTYPDTGVVSGELHVPLGREVLLNITANDVLHAFWVPEFRLKQDAIPGRQSELSFTPSKEGEYPVICAELCGAYHGAMRTKVVVHSASDYDAWITSQQVASAEGLQQAIATSAVDQSVDQFLSPFVQSIGVQPDQLTQLHPAAGHYHPAS
jgi:cytochrome c oxidase subunit 2